MYAVDMLHKTIYMTGIQISAEVGALFQNLATGVFNTDTSHKHQLKKKI